jgi:trimeric autotransporter adhesin
MSFVNRKLLGLVVLLAMLGLPLSSAMAQTTYGAVRGLAKDPQGAVIADATVTLRRQIQVNILSRRLIRECIPYR